MSVLDFLCPHGTMLAPMVGLTHWAVRQAVSEFLPPGARSLWPTEMLNSRRIPGQTEGQSPELCFDDKANGLGPQLLGNEEVPIRESVRKLEDWGAIAVDINMGCPVKKALSHNYGVSLMGDPDYAARVTEIAATAGRLPVSVKLRAGLNNDPDFLLRFTKRLRDAGAAWITLHPRTAAEQRRGRADWSQIRFLKSELGIPVVGNGDVQCREDILAMREATGCDRVMIGRALMAKPWLLREEAEPSPEEQAKLYGKFLKRVLELSRSRYAEEAGLRRMIFLAHHGGVWLDFGHALKAGLHKAKSYEAAAAFLDDYFERPLRMSARTELRA